MVSGGMKTKGRWHDMVVLLKDIYLWPVAVDAHTCSNPNKESCVFAH